MLNFSAHCDLQFSLTYSKTNKSWVTEILTKKCTCDTNYEVCVLIKSYINTMIRCELPCTLSCAYITNYDWLCMHITGKMFTNMMHRKIIQNIQQIYYSWCFKIFPVALAGWRSMYCVS